MRADDRGREWMTTITLSPHIVFDGDVRPTQTQVDALHHESHDACYIANTIRSEVVVKGQAGGIRVEG